MKPSSTDLPTARPAGSSHSPILGMRGTYATDVADFDFEHDRLMRRREVQRVTGLSRSSLYRQVAAGTFPSAIRISDNAVGWLATEVALWVAKRVQATRNGTDGAASPAGAS